MHSYLFRSSPIIGAVFLAFGLGLFSAGSNPASEVFMVTGLVVVSPVLISTLYRKMEPASRKVQEPLPVF